MHVDLGSGAVLATLSKHRIGGLVAIVIGALVVIFGGIRMMSKVATAPLVPLLGIAVVVLGIMLFARVI